MAPLIALLSNYFVRYVEMRRIGNTTKNWSGGIKTITATPRQLESLIRLSEAHAKMRLSDTVESQDVDEALRLVQVAMQQSAIDPITGTIDMVSSKLLLACCTYVMPIGPNNHWQVSNQEKSHRQTRRSYHSISPTNEDSRCSCKVV